MHDTGSNICRRQDNEDNDEVLIDGIGVCGVVGSIGIVDGIGVV